MEETIGEQLLREAKEDLSVRQQAFKDKFIDNIISFNQIWQKNINDFVNEWNQLVAKKNQLDQKTITDNKVISGDKLNKA